MPQLPVMAPQFRFLAFVQVLLLAVGQICPAGTDAATQIYGYEVVAEYPHDVNAFTQGACWCGSARHS